MSADNISLILSFFFLSLTDVKLTQLSVNFQFQISIMKLVFKQTLAQAKTMDTQDRTSMSNIIWSQMTLEIFERPSQLLDYNSIKNLWKKQTQDHFWTGGLCLLSSGLSFFRSAFFFPTGGSDKLIFCWFQMLVMKGLNYIIAAIFI